MSVNFSKNGVMQGSPQEILITDKSIQQLQFIDADETSYIKTDYTGSDNYQIDCKMEILGAVNSNYWFGQTQSHGAMMYNGLYNNRALEYNWLTITFTNSNLVEMSQTQINDTQVKININGQEFIRDIGTNDGTGNFLIFACNNVRYYGSAMRFWYLRMHVGSRYILNLIPAYKNNIVGLYDTVNSKFYSNSGTGIITAGPVLVAPSIGTNNIVSNNFYEC